MWILWIANHFLSGIHIQVLMVTNLPILRGCYRNKVTTQSDQWNIPLIHGLCMDYLPFTTLSVVSPCLFR